MPLWILSECGIHQNNLGYGKGRVLGTQEHPHPHVHAPPKTAQPWNRANCNQQDNSTTERVSHLQHYLGFLSTFSNTSEKVFSLATLTAVCGTKGFLLRTVCCKINTNSVETSP